MRQSAPVRIGAGATGNGRPYRDSKALRLYLKSVTPGMLTAPDQLTARRHTEPFLVRSLGPFLSTVPLLVSYQGPHGPRRAPSKGASKGKQS